jgi:hypothetical protein
MRCGSCESSERYCTVYGLAGSAGCSDARGVQNTPNYA